jgi:hypothetical protein
LTINQGSTVNAVTNTWSLGYNSGSCVNSITINGGTLNFTGPNANGGTAASSISMTGGSISGSQFDWYNNGSVTPANFTLTTNANSTTAVVSSGFNLRLGGNQVTLNVAQGTTASGVDLSITGPITPKAKRMASSSPVPARSRSPGPTRTLVRRT